MSASPPSASDSSLASPYEISSLYFEQVVSTIQHNRTLQGDFQSLKETEDAVERVNEELRGIEMRIEKCQQKQIKWFAEQNEGVHHLWPKLYLYRFRLSFLWDTAKRQEAASILHLQEIICEISQLNSEIASIEAKAVANRIELTEWSLKASHLSQVAVEAIPNEVLDTMQELDTLYGEAVSLMMLFNSGITDDLSHSSCDRL